MESRPVCPLCLASVTRHGVLQFVRVVACVSAPFLSWTITFLGLDALIRSSIDRQLSCFRLLVTVNSTAVKAGAHVLCGRVFSVLPGAPLRTGAAGSALSTFNRPHFLSKDPLFVLLPWNLRKCSCPYVSVCQLFIPSLEDGFASPREFAQHGGAETWL